MRTKLGLFQLTIIKIRSDFVTQKQGSFIECVKCVKHNFVTSAVLSWNELIMGNKLRLIIINTIYVFS